MRILIIANTVVGIRKEKRAVVEHVKNHIEREGGTVDVAYLYERGELTGREGIVDIGKFFQERWKGIHSILWGDQLIQAELMESIHCGLFDEELHTPSR